MHTEIGEYSGAPETRDFLKSSFEEECFAVDATSDGESGSYMARVNDYDLIILDHILPGKDGFEICDDVRQGGKHTPILMLSVKSEIDQKISDMELIWVDVLGFKNRKKLKVSFKRKKSYESKAPPFTSLSFG